MASELTTRTLVRDLMPKELGKSGDAEFSATLALLCDYYLAYLDNPSISLAYQMIKLHAIDVLIGGEWASYDSEQIDIVEKESQKFDHLMKLREIVVGVVAGELAADGLTYGIAIGTMNKKQPLPYSEYLGYFNPNSIYYSGTPLPYWTNTE